MVDITQTSPMRAGTLAQQIVSILINEDSETRKRAVHAAMMLLGETPSLEEPSQSKTPHNGQEADDEADLAALFSRDDKLKPSDNAQLCAAYHFSIYGTAAFSLEDIRTIAREAGVVLPDRLDKTLAQAANKGKKFFQPAGKGLLKPTAFAGLSFKERWNIKPGKKAKGVATVKE